MSQENGEEDFMASQVGQFTTEVKLIKFDLLHEKYKSVESERLLLLEQLGQAESRAKTLCEKNLTLRLEAINMQAAQKALSQLRSQQWEERERTNEEETELQTVLKAKLDLVNSQSLATAKTLRSQSRDFPQLVEALDGGILALVGSARSASLKESAELCALFAEQFTSLLWIFRNGPLAKMKGTGSGGAGTVAGGAEFGLSRDEEEMIETIHDTANELAELQRLPLDHGITTRLSGLRLKIEAVAESMRVLSTQRLLHSPLHDSGPRAPPGELHQLAADVEFLKDKFFATFKVQTLDKLDRLAQKLRAAKDERRAQADQIAALREELQAERRALESRDKAAVRFLTALRSALGVGGTAVDGLPRAKIDILCLQEVDKVAALAESYRDSAELLRSTAPAAPPSAAESNQNFGDEAQKATTNDLAAALEAAHRANRDLRARMQQPIVDFPSDQLISREVAREVAEGMLSQTRDELEKTRALVLHLGKVNEDLFAKYQAAQSEKTVLKQTRLVQLKVGERLRDQATQVFMAQQRVIQMLANDQKVKAQTAKVFESAIRAETQAAQKIVELQHLFETLEVLQRGTLATIAKSNAIRLASNPPALPSSGPPGPAGSDAYDLNSALLEIRALTNTVENQEKLSRQLFADLAAFRLRAAQIGSLSTKLDGLAAQNILLKGLVRSIVRERDQASSENQLEIQHTRQIIDSCFNSLASASAQISGLREAAASARLESARAEARLQAAEEAAKSEADELRREVADARRVTESLKAQLQKEADLLARNDQLRSEKSAVAELNDSLTTENISLRQNVQQLQKTITRLTDELVTHALPSTDTDFSRRRLEGAEKELSARIEQRENKLTEALAEVATLNSVCADLQRQIDFDKFEKETLISQLNGLRSDLQTKDHQLASAQLERESITDEVRLLKRQLSEQTQHAQELVDSERLVVAEQLRVKFEQSLAEAHATAQNARLRENELLATIASLEEQRDSHTQRLQARNKLLVEFHQLFASAGKDEFALARLANANRALTVELETIRVREKYLEALVGNSRFTGEFLVSEKSEDVRPILRKKLPDEPELLDQVEKMIALRDDQLAAFKDSFDSLNRTVRDQQTTITDLTELLTDLKSQLPKEEEIKNEQSPAESERPAEDPVIANLKAFAKRF